MYKRQYEDIRNNPVIEDVLAEQFTRLGETVMPRRKELGIGCTDVGNLTHAFPALQSLSLIHILCSFVRVSLTINSNPGFLLYSPATL